MAFHSWITTNNGDTGQCELTASKDSQAQSQTDSLLLFVIFMGHDLEWRAVFEQKQSQYWVYLQPKKKKKSRNVSIGFYYNTTRIGKLRNCWSYAEMW